GLTRRPRENHSGGTATFFDSLTIQRYLCADVRAISATSRTTTWMPGSTSCFTFWMRRLRSASLKEGSGTTRISHVPSPVCATCEYLMPRSDLNAKVTTEGLIRWPCDPKRVSSYLPATGSITGYVRPHGQSVRRQRVRSDIR